MKMLIWTTDIKKASIIGLLCFTLLMWQHYVQIKLQLAISNHLIVKIFLIDGKLYAETSLMTTGEKNSRTCSIFNLLYQAFMYLKVKPKYYLHH